MEGPVELVSSDTESLIIQLSPHFRSRFKQLAVQQPIGKAFDVSVKIAASFIETQPDGMILMHPIENPTVQISDFFPRRSIVQNRTLWGLCYFIGWVQEGRKPDKETVYWIYRGILEEFAPTVINPKTLEREPMSSSHPQMTTRIMGSLINGALQTLMSEDLPTHVEQAIGEEMRDLWRAFYKWRYHDYTDMLEEHITWSEYLERVQVCEACGIKGTDTDKLERAHIISAGADKTIYEESWNWLCIHSRHHGQLQHQHGWETFLKAYPHLRPKVEHARKKYREQGEKDA